MEYPVTLTPGRARSNEKQFALVRYRLREPLGVCAGPRFIRAQYSASPEVVSSTTFKWPTHYAERVMLTIRNKKSSFGPDANFIHIPGPCKSPRKIDLSCTAAEIDRVTLPTVRSRLECKVWPQGNPIMELYVHDNQVVPPPQQSVWDLLIKAEREEDKPLFHSVLVYSSPWPPALLEPLFSVPESVFLPGARADRLPRMHPTVQIFNPAPS